RPSSHLNPLYRWPHVGARCNVPLLFLLFYLLWSGICWAEVDRSPVGLDLKEYRLKNGLTLLMHEDHSAPIISLQVWYNVGSRNERPGITGISHLFEHMMFKGSARFGPEEHSRLVTLNGGNDNAFTTQDCTAYFENLPNSRLELAAELEADRMASLRLTPETLASEREVVKEERRLRVDNSLSGVLAEELYATAFSLHPYQWPVSGWMSDLDAISLEDCQEFFLRYYAPNNATVLVLGDIDPDETVRVIERHFGPIPSHENERPRGGITPEAPQKGERQANCYVSTQFPWVVVAYHIPATTHPDVPALELLSSLLGEGRSARLYQKLIRGQMALSFSTDVDKMKDPGLFTITVEGIQKGYTPEDIESAIYAELEKLREERVSDRELQKAKNQKEARLIFGLQGNFIRGIRIGSSLAESGDPLFFLKVLERYRQATAEELLRVAREYFNRKNRVVVRLLPETWAEGP
ncbi:MAG: pitrilysin family protein, partial [Planctomycetota bacterium]